MKKPREKRTLIPSFDPEELAKELERESSRVTVAPPFDPSSYARIVDERGLAATQRSGVDVGEGERAQRAPMTSGPRPSPPSRAEVMVDEHDADTAGRAMYGCYLASDFPTAMTLAERVLSLVPEHALARLVLERCRERLQANAHTLSPSSVLRLKYGELERKELHIDATSSFVLGHVDGISDAATVAALTGLPDMEALERLHALLELGVLEVVSSEPS